MEGAMRKESAFGKVIVRTRDKRLFRGFSKAELIREKIQLVDSKGKKVEFPLDELKAIFFVRDFEGDPTYREVRFLGKSSLPAWVWVQVTFVDGEIMEGRIRNDKSLLDPLGFFMWVADEGTNNELVYIVRSALRDLRIAGLR